jgi:hypothetical protein
MVHPICFDDTAVASAPVADTDTDINSEQAAAASRESPSDDAPLPRKHLQRHSINNKSFKKTTVAEHRPRTHDEREALKKPGTAPTMFAYLSLPPGRPKKKISTSNATATDTVTANPVEGLESPSEPAPKKRGTYGKWDKEASHKRAKQVVVTCLIETGDVFAALKAVESTHPTIKVPRQTALSWLKKIQESCNKANKDDAADTLAAFDRDAVPTAMLDLNRKGSLTTLADREFLQSVMIARDLRNAGMSRKEAISIIANLVGVNLTTAENHFDYLIRSKQLPKLKNNGRVITTQATTTNRTACTTEKFK